MEAFGSLISRSTLAASCETRLLKSGPITPPSPRIRWQVEHFNCSLKNKLLPPSKSPLSLLELVAARNSAEGAALSFALPSLFSTTRDENKNLGGTGLSIGSVAVK